MSHQFSHRFHRGKSRVSEISLHSRQECLLNPSELLDFLTASKFRMEGYCMQGAIIPTMGICRIIFEETQIL
jgi:hypothetical protein